mmetsp:Transcript_55125/g.118334  ORF Transcript_55125/g.118334 Transcript_55125/m.118334 type:complete len:201 (-) Transcript_55125:1756-2358(-)
MRSGPHHPQNGPARKLHRGSLALPQRCQHRKASKSCCRSPRKSLARRPCKCWHPVPGHNDRLDTECTAPPWGHGKSLLRSASSPWRQRSYPCLMRKMYTYLRPCHSRSGPVCKPDTPRRRSPRRKSPGGRAHKPRWRPWSSSQHHRSGNCLSPARQRSGRLGKPRTALRQYCWSRSLGRRESMWQLRRTSCRIRPDMLDM